MASRRMLITAFDAGTQTRCDFYLNASSDDTLSGILPSLASLLGVVLLPSTPIAVDGAIVARTATLGDLHLHEGSWITLLSGRNRMPNGFIPQMRPLDGSLELKIISGDDAGRIYALSAGIAAIGTQTDATIQLNAHARATDLMGFRANINPDSDSVGICPLLNVEKLLRHSAAETYIYSDATGFTGFAKARMRRRIRRAISKGRAHSAITINGTELLEPCEVPLKTPIHLPFCTIMFDRFNATTIPVHEDSDTGKWAFSRPPKISRKTNAPQFELPEYPHRPERMPIPILMSLLPLIASVAMAYFMKTWSFLAFGLLSPIMMLSSSLSGNRNSKKRYKRELKEYDAELSYVIKAANAAQAKEAANRIKRYPDPATLLQTCQVHNAQLWERRIGGLGWMEFRIGSGSVPSHVRITAPQTGFRRGSFGSGVAGSRPDSDSNLERSAQPLHKAQSRAQQKQHKHRATRRNRNQAREYQNTRALLAARWLEDVPVTINLAQAGCIGITGETDAVYQLAQWMTTQSCALHSTNDLSLMLLAPAIPATDSEPASAPMPASATASAPMPATAPAPESSIQQLAERWSFCQWLPHFATLADQSGSLRAIGINAEQIAARIAALTDILTARSEQLSHASLRTWNGPVIITILDNAHVLRAQPGMIRLLAEGPRVGMYFICIDTDSRLLPEECKTIITAEGNETSVRSSVDAEDGLTAQPDKVNLSEITALALYLAPMTDASPQSDDSAIPNSCRLLSELGLSPTAAQIESGWQLNPRSTSFLIGEAMGGPFSLDIAKDGPHALVAGTTGSGKSELLQSMVASLAAANTPEEMNFVLVDYKGGAAFKDCVRLPHTVGMVTDLDSHLVERALVSLGAELTYREHMLAAAGAKDIDDYTDLRQIKPGLPALPRLMIIIDEFASLSRELPDFVAGLVSIAQRGRSLGIHLVLATQKPGGVVSPEIRANTSLRIALRTTDASESQDVIDSKDAALISKAVPGRALARLGSSTLIPFQSARIGGKHASANKHTANSAEPHETPLIRILPFTQTGDHAPTRPKRKDSSSSLTTDLQVLVAAISEASTAAGFLAPRKPWLPALDTHIGLAELKQRMKTDAHAGFNLTIPFALGDFPESQKQEPLSIDLAHFGNLFVIGTARSGKSTALKTIAYSACTRIPVRNLHIYGIDAGNGSILPLTSFPHVGAIAQRNQTQKTQRLIKRLTKEMSKRSDMLSAGGYSSIDEYNANLDAPGAHPLPHIIVLIDSWAGFSGTYEGFDGGSLFETTITLMREGTAAGIHFIVSGGKELFGGQVNALSENKILLRLVDKSSYSAIGMLSRSVPDEIPNGRAWRSQDAAELQIAQIAPNARGQEEAAQIRAAAHMLKQQRRFEAWELPFNVEQLPENLSLQELYEKAGIAVSTSASAAGLLAPPLPGGVHTAIAFALGGDDNRPIEYDPAHIKMLPIFGMGKSGKSTLLETLLLGALTSGYHPVLISPRHTHTLETARQHGVATITDPSELTESTLRPLVENQPDNLILIDDAHIIAEIPAGNWLLAALQSGRESSASFAIAIHANQLHVGFNSWCVALRNCETGIALQPTDGSLPGLIGSEYSRSYAQTLNAPGRGIYNDGSQTLQFQSATPIPPRRNNKQE